MLSNERPPFGTIFPHQLYNFVVLLEIIFEKGKHKFGCNGIPCHENSSSTMYNCKMQPLLVYNIRLGEQILEFQHVRLPLLKASVRVLNFCFQALWPLLSKGPSQAQGWALSAIGEGTGHLYDLKNGLQLLSSYLFQCHPQALSTFHPVN